MVLTALPGPALGGGGDTYVVTTTADSGGGSLRQAILDANANPGLDTITFDPSVFPEGNPGVINLASNLPEINGSEGITISGAGAGVIINGIGGNTAQGFRFGPFASEIVDVTIEHITIRDANDALDMSGQSVSQVVLDNLNIDEPSGTSADGVNVFGNTTVNGFTLRNSSVQGTGDGLNLYSLEGTSNVTVEEVEASNNQQGLNIGSSQTLTNVSIIRLAVNNNGFQGANFFGGGGISDLSVSESSANGNNGDGVHVTSSAGLQNASFVDLTMNDNDGSGLNLFAAGNLDGVSAEGNEANGNRSNGLSVFAGSNSDYTNVTVWNNQASDNQSGISTGGGPCRA